MKNVYFINVTMMGNKGRDFPFPPFSCKWIKVWCQLCCHLLHSTLHHGTGGRIAPSVLAPVLVLAGL